MPTIKNGMIVFAEKSFAGEIVYPHRGVSTKTWQPGTTNRQQESLTLFFVSDPLTQFACVFSALNHGVDHTGVPNTQLVKEGSRIAKFYLDKSVDEQNSVDLAWDLFMNH